MGDSTYIEALNTYRDTRRQHFSGGRYHPFRLPTDIAAFVFLACYLICSRRWLLTSRVLTFLSIVSLSILSMQSSRCVGPAISYFVGIANAWFILVAINMLFVFNPRRDLRRRKAKTNDKTSDSAGADMKDTSLIWEAMPDSTPKRIPWVLDLLGSPRLLHWSSPYTSRSNRASQVRLQDYETNGLTGKKVLTRLLLVFFAVDIVKELVALDPYFWGKAGLDRQSGDLGRTTISIGYYHLLVDVSLVFLALRILTTYGHLLFVCFLGPSIVGTWGHAWSWRPLHGSILYIYTHGLIGFWGEVWHQMFRIMLTAPTSKLIEILDLDPRGKSAALLALFSPFCISGIIHACGSHTLSNITNPWHPWLFFMLQPVGIIIQKAGNQLIKARCSEAVTHHVNGVFNTCFSCFWLVLTFPLFASDVARGGVFLAEPFPLGILHFFGTGSKRAWGNLWDSPGIEWHSGKRWWESGIAVG